MALQAQLVLALGAQQFRVFSAVRLVAGRATLFIRRLVYMPFLLQFGLIAVAGQADFVGDDGDELYAGDVSVDPDFMAAHAAHRNRRMDRLAFCLVSMALDALGAVGLRIEWDRVNGGGGARNQQRGQRKENQYMNAKNIAAAICGRLAEPNTMGEQSHTASKGCVCTKVAVSQEPGCESQHAPN